MILLSLMWWKFHSRHLQLTWTYKHPKQRSVLNSIDLFPRSHKPITPPKKSHLLATSWHHRQCLIHRPPCFLVARSTHIDMSSSWMPRFEKHHLATNILWFQSLGLNGEKHQKRKPMTGKPMQSKIGGGFHWIPVKFHPPNFFKTYFQWNSNQFPTEVSCAPCFFVWKWPSWWVGRWGFPTITDPGTDADPPADPMKNRSAGWVMEKTTVKICLSPRDWVNWTVEVEVFDSSFWWFHQVNLVNFHGIFVENRPANSPQ